MRWLQDGILRIQKVAAVKIVFRGAPGWFQGTKIYIGEGGRPGEPRGAHDGGGRALPPGCTLLPRGFLAASPTSSPSLLVCFRSKKDHHEGFIPFGFRLIFLFFETLK